MYRGRTRTRVWCTLADGTPHGPAVIYRSLSDPMWVGSYDNGKRHGLFREPSDASLYTEYHYVQGVQEGPCRWVDRGGVTTGKLIAGQREGLWDYGSLERKHKSCYIGGLEVASCEGAECPLDCTLPDGPVALPNVTGALRGGRPVGLWTATEYGTLYTATFVDGLRDGPYMRGTPEDVSYKTGSYRAGKKDGLWTTYLRGELESRQRWEGGRGGVVERYRDGKLASTTCLAPRGLPLRPGEFPLAMDENRLYIDDLPDPLPPCL